LLTALKRRRTSYLAQAIATDVELYEKHYTGESPRKRKSPPDLIEVGLAETLLMGIHELLQQVVGFTAGQKKPKVKPIPRPETAAQIFARTEARKQYDLIMDVLNFVPQEQFERSVTQSHEGVSGGELLGRHGDGGHPPLAEEVPLDHPVGTEGDQCP
jgi:hypothetical protein